MPRKFSESVRLSPVAKDKLIETSDKLGVQQGVLISQLIGWFAIQGTLIQGALLRHFASSFDVDVNKLMRRDIANAHGNTERSLPADGHYPNADEDMRQA